MKFFEAIKDFFAGYPDEKELDAQRERIKTRRAGQYLHEKVLWRGYKFSLFLGILAGLFVGGLTLGWAASFFAPSNFFVLLNSIALLFFVFIVVSVPLANRYIKNTNKYLFGYYGEREVAEAIDNIGRLPGWAIFHDFPLRKGNIDHIIVSPNGVFCIETKHLTKKSSQKLIYDGKAIKFESGKYLPRNPVEQAAEIRERLLEILDEEFHGIPVYSIVAFVDWYVSAQNKGGVCVLNAKQIESFVNEKQKVVNDNINADIAENIIKFLDGFTYKNIRQCPQCGGDLVLRTAKKGKNPGEKFYGCSSYPKCTHTEKIPAA